MIGKNDAALWIHFNLTNQLMNEQINGIITPRIFIRGFSDFGFEFGVVHHHVHPENKVVKISMEESGK